MTDWQPIKRISTKERMPEKYVPVIVAGGIAMLRASGKWYSGMEEPMFKRFLAWEPQWWAKIPIDNDPLIPDRPDPPEGA